MSESFGLTLARGVAPQSLARQSGAAPFSAAIARPGHRPCRRDPLSAHASCEPSSQANSIARQRRCSRFIRSAKRAPAGRTIRRSLVCSGATRRLAPSSVSAWLRAFCSLVCGSLAILYS